MSLAMYAAPFIENDDYKNNDNRIYRKKQIHNKTQKTFTKEGFDTEKVNNVLQTIHQNSKEEDSGLDGGGSLGDFNPPPKPESSGVKKTIATEQMMNITDENNQNMYKVLGKSPSPNNENNPDSELELNNYNTNYGKDSEIEEYYKRFIPNYQNQKNKSSKIPSIYQNQSDNISSFHSAINDNNLLMQKLNYMINLLEEKQDEKTNNVTEEVVLYSFLGIFIIFIVDSFARMGKYVR